MKSTHLFAHAVRRLAAAVLGLSLVTLAMGASARDDADHEPLVVAKLGNFFVGGTHNANDQIVGQMYVEYRIPQNQKHPFPIIFVHGGGQLGVGWNETPDGREGWAPYFLRRGYAVYVVDQPARGRSPYHSSLGPLSDANNSLNAQRLWAAIERSKLWPAAILHTQWVGPAVDGDPTFEQFLSSQTAAIGNVPQYFLTADALVALLEKIGPAILIPHSQPGWSSWAVADRRPSLVKGLIQIEPGPTAHATQPFGLIDVPWGLAFGPIAYSPPVTDPSQLIFEDVPVTDPYVSTCRLQKEPARQLPNMAKVPILLLSSPSGYNTLWDRCTHEYLKQAGVGHTWLKLQDIGIHGNGHFMFIEKNSDEVAGVVLDWIESHVED
jgi:pimeloyl-ACP methyl ester carboxylesterase